MDIEAENHFMTKTYAYMALSLLLSFVSSIVFAHTGLIYLFASYGIESSIIWLVILGLEFFMIYRISRVAFQNPTLGKIGLMAFSVLDGATMAGMFAIYSVKIISLAFLLAIIDFASMSAVGFIMKKSTAHLRKQLIAMVFALLVVWIVELFLQSPAILMIFSGISIIIFSVLTICDTNMLRRLAYQYGDSDSLAVIGALELYLDFINIFTDILNLLGFSNNN